MPRPTVGIIANFASLDGDYPAQASGEMNVNAIARVSNALPVIIPSLPNCVTAEELCAQFDGFLFTGGRPNVHPSHYGEEETAAHGVFDKNRDAITLPLIRHAVELGRPILGICRGFQEFNVAFGGTLHPEIRDLPGRMNHRMPPEGTLDEKFELRHDVALTPDGVFANLFGATQIRTNTLHGQGIKEAGARIVIDGYAEDGTPEAIYIKDTKAFAMAVQWHPEYRAQDDPNSRPLFEAFGQALANT